jgi:hypothetical protein
VRCPIRLQVQASHHTDMISPEIRRRVKGGERGRVGRNGSDGGDLPQIGASEWTPTPGQTRLRPAIVSAINAHRHSEAEDAKDEQAQPPESNLPAQTAEHQEPDQQKQNSHAARHKAPHVPNRFLGSFRASNQDDACCAKDQDCEWNPGTNAATGRGG